MAQRILIKAEFNRLAAHQLVILQLHAGEPLAIHSRHPDHRRGQVALRVETFIFAHRTYALEPKLLNFARTRQWQMTRKPYEWGSGSEPRSKSPGTYPKHRGQTRQVSRRSGCEQ